MSSPTAIIAEDEAPLRAELKGHLETLWPELKIVGVAANGIEALEMFDRFKASVIFVDVVMPGLTGLDVARQVEGLAHVVFVTAYDAHAIQAFEQGAVDYLLKPHSVARLALALRRVRERLVVAPMRLDTLLRDLARSSEKREHLKWINASRGNEIQLVTVDEVLYFQADTKYTRVVTENGEALIRKSLKELAEQLDPAQFWTIHRSTIVNADAIAAVVRDMSGAMCVKLKSRPEKLRVSEAFRSLFRQM
jgi:DNA-binding LytR/AlgR family response regulator